MRASRASVRSPISSAAYHSFSGIFARPRGEVLNRDASVDARWLIVVVPVELPPPLLLGCPIIVSLLLRADRDVRRQVGNRSEQHGRSDEVHDDAGAMPGELDLIGHDVLGLVGAR